jgi:two-component sensor histidine kinase
METPSAFLRLPPARLGSLFRRLARIPGARYWAAAALVLISLWVRLQLSPFLAGYGYICFYPGVILSAYWLGGRPGLMAAGLSTVIVYNFMGPAPFSFPTDGQAMVGLGFFLVSSLLLIHVLSTIRARLNTLTTKHAQIEALAMGQAELFRDHAQRTTDHLQLISAILHLRAREEADPMVSRVLTNAASRTLVISRTHREFTGGGDRRIPFNAFARKLVEAAAVRGGVPSDRVRIAGGARDIPLEQATSLGLVLLEYLNTLKAQRSAVALAVTLDEDGMDRCLDLAVVEGEGPTPHDIPLFEAITEQLGGRLLITRGAPSGGGGGGVRITFPAEIQPAERWSPVAVSLH